MGHVSILLDEMRLDEMGLDEMGINRDQLMSLIKTQGAADPTRSGLEAVFIACTAQ